jgi:uncharacterized protein (TIGR02453 family)
MVSKPFFSKELFDYLRELKRNNRRDWFEKHKDRYEVYVKYPLLGFIGSFGPSLSKISPSFLSDTRPMGGSMFRIYRDTRFSKDKTPYKTHAAAQFRHRVGKDVHAPGFYLHLEPGGVFAGGGLWRPETQVAGQIRDAMVNRPSEWMSIVSKPAFKKTCKFEGEKLSRPPHGYDKNHPMIEWLKYKDFTFFTEFTEKEACSSDFMEKVANCFKTGRDLMGFLTGALGLEFETGSKPSSRQANTVFQKD